MGGYSVLFLFQSILFFSLLCTFRFRSSLRLTVREAEAKFKKQRDQVLAQGNDWERVAALCDLSRRHAETARMREVLQICQNK
jgi:hypothetical protein